MFQRIIAEVPEIILRCRSRDEAALAVAQKVVATMMELILIFSKLASRVFVDVCENFYKSKCRFLKACMRMQQTAFMSVLILLFWLQFGMFASLLSRSLPAG